MAEDSTRNGEWLSARYFLFFDTFGIFVPWDAQRK